MNGANRLGGNSLSDLLVFGRRTGEAAVRHGAAAPAPRIDDAEIADAAAEMTRHLSGPGDEDPYRLHAELQATMQADVGIFRDETGLSAAIARIGELERRAADARSATSVLAYNPGWHLCRDVHNMLDRLPGGRARRPPATREPGRPQPARLHRIRRLLERAQHHRPQDRGRHAGRAAGRSPRPRRWRRSSRRARRPSGHERAHTAAVARRRRRRRARRLRGRGRVRAWSCSTPCWRSSAATRRTSPSAGTARPPSAARAAPRSTAAPR